MSSNLTEPGSAGLRLRKQQPAIWSSGRQAPRFDAGAFLSASTTRALRLASRGLGAAGTLARRGANALGKPSAGEDARPSSTRQAVARTTATTARLIELARDRLSARLPPQPAPAAPARPEPASAVGALRIVRPARPSATPADADADIMEAIRSVVHMANVAPARPVRLPADPEPAMPVRRASRLPDLAPQEPLPPGPMLRNGAVAMAAITVALAWPVGATLSLLAHLRGEDLRAAP